MAFVSLLIKRRGMCESWGVMMKEVQNGEAVSCEGGGDGVK